MATDESAWVLACGRMRRTVELKPSAWSHAVVRWVRRPDESDEDAAEA